MGMLSSVGGANTTNPCSSVIISNSISTHLHLNISHSSSPQFHSSTPRFPRLRSSSFPSPPPSGESESKTILDAFFLGKALGEALTERIESTVGEFLSTVGRLQAEQQKQIQDFQEDVVERAKRAKERAAREALEEQGRIIRKSTKANVSAVNGSSPSTMPTDNGSASLDSSASFEDSESPTSSEDEDRGDQDSLSSVRIDD